MATVPAADVPLTPLGGEARPISDWVTTFHLVLVALDPYTHESSWLLDTAGRIFQEFSGANCRVAWLVTTNDDKTREFLGPWADQFLTFADPDRQVVKALGLETLPALVHLDHNLNVVGAAEGWDPAEWRQVVANLADDMQWSRPLIPALGDPTPYAGTPAT